MRSSEARSRTIPRAAAVAAIVLLAASRFPLAAQGAAGAPRHALVIGNASYTDLPRLKNPVNDAEDIAAALKDLGFSVTLVTDATRKAMSRAVVAFRETLALDRASEGVFYFAGHGVQSKGSNYLIPIGAEIKAEADLEDEAVSAQRVLSSLEEARNRVNLVVLDACRDNPLPAATRSSARGLAVVGTAPPETVVVYSTGAGQTAADGAGRNSPFARALLAHLSDPGDITAAVKAVTGDVKTATGGAQTPYLYSSLTRDFAMVPSSAAARLEGRASQPPTASPPPGPAAPRLLVTRAYGSLVVTAKAAGELLVDGKEMGLLPANAEARLDSLEVGNHAVELRYSADASEKRDVSVEKGKAASVAFTALALKSADGRTVYSTIGDTDDNPLPLPRRSIALDGDSRDWDGISPIWTAPPGTKSPFGQEGTELLRLYLCRDDQNLYWRYDFASANPLVKRPASVKSRIVYQLSIKVDEQRKLQLQLYFDRDSNQFGSQCSIIGEKETKSTPIGKNIVKSNDSMAMSEGRVAIAAIAHYLRGSLPVWAEASNVDQNGKWSTSSTPRRYVDFR